MAESVHSILSRRRVALALAGAALTLGAAFGPSGAKITDAVSGAATVIDGDTLAIGVTHASRRHRRAGGGADLQAGRARVVAVRPGRGWCAREARLGPACGV